MKITGKNLALAHVGIGLSLQEVHNQIAQCPDVVEFADEIESLESLKKSLESLQLRMARSILRENNE